MDNTDILNANKFVQIVLSDAEVLTGLSDNAVLNEDQYYLRTVGFYLVSTLNWCEQLDHAVIFLSNYNYAKKSNASRADHFIFNVENYFIRLNSIYDRVLQVINAVFQLGIHEQHVRHDLIISNHKVAQKPHITSKVKAIKSFLQSHEQKRHTLIHRHSYLEKKLHRLKFFYLHSITTELKTEKVEELKQFRAIHLRELLEEKKDKFSKVNKQLTILLNDLFLALFDEYIRQKDQLG